MMQPEKYLVGSLLFLFTVFYFFLSTFLPPVFPFLSLSLSLFLLYHSE